MFESLGFLSDQQVRDGALAAVANERESTLVVLNFLIGIEKRRLYLEDGYSSVFEFCTAAWGYSSSAAWRRIQTARCIVKFPRILEMLERNEVNPSTIAQASRILNEKNCDEVLARICRKSQREVESIVPEYSEKESSPRERARTVVVRIPTLAAIMPPSLTHSTPESSDSITPQACDESDYCLNADNKESPPTDRISQDRFDALPVVHSAPEQVIALARCGPEMSTETTAISARSPIAPLASETGPSADAEVVLQKRVALTLSVPVEFMTKIERLRAVTWHRVPAGASFTYILDLALDTALSVRDPAVRSARRAKRKRETREKATPKSERYISPGVRDEVCQRDEHRCTYLSKDGHRCTATVGLQVDHIQPIARGGTSTIENLRLLCAQHNRHAAERLMGPRPRR